MDKKYDPYDHQTISFSIDEKLHPIDCEFYSKLDNFEIFVSQSDSDDSGYPLYSGYIWDNNQDKYVYETKYMESNAHKIWCDLESILS